MPSRFLEPYSSKNGANRGANPAKLSHLEGVVTPQRTLSSIITHNSRINWWPTLISLGSRRAPKKSKKLQIDRSHTLAHARTRSHTSRIAKLTFSDFFRLFNVLPIARTNTFFGKIRPIIFYFLLSLERPSGRIIGQADVFVRAYLLIWDIRKGPR